MARTVTLASLRTQAQQRADMENTAFITNTEWNEMINASLAELYDLLTTVYEDYFSSTAVFVSSAELNTYPLPADFYKLIGIDQGTGTNLYTLEPYELAERNHYQAFNQAGETFTILYVPACPILVLDADTFDGVNGWEEYTVVDVAMKARIKEETDIEELERAKLALSKRIEDSAPNRDAGMGGRVTDVHKRDPYWGITAPSPARYRIMGGNIVLRSLIIPLGFA